LKVKHTAIAKITRTVLKPIGKELIMSILSDANDKIKSLEGDNKRLKDIIKKLRELNENCRKEHAKLIIDRKINDI
jgi:hypothetical protein